jgi:transcriptional regulator with XRE-family HTH domain
VAANRENGASGDRQNLTVEDPLLSEKVDAINTRPLCFSEGQRLLLCIPLSLSQIGRSVGLSKQIVSEWRYGRRVPSVGARLRLQTAFGIDADAWTQEPTGPAPDPPLRASSTGPKVATGPELSRAVVATQPNGSESSGPPYPPHPSSAAAAAATGLPRLPAGSLAASFASTVGQVDPSYPTPLPTAKTVKPAPASSSPSTMEGVETLLRTIREHRKKAGLLAAEQVKLADAETRLLSLRHRLEKEVELSDERIVKGHPMWVRIKSTIATTLVRWPDAARAVAAALREIEK